MNFKYSFSLFCGGYDLEDNEITDRMAQAFINNDWKCGFFKHLLEDMGVATNGGSYPECTVEHTIEYYDEDNNTIDGTDEDAVAAAEHTYKVSGEIHGIEGFNPQVDGYKDMFTLMWYYLEDYIDSNYEYGTTECGVNMLSITLHTCEEI